MHDELVERLAGIASALSVGDPSDREAQTGPVANAAAVERFERAVAEARRDGELAAGGEALGGGGHFVAPTVVAGLPAGHRLTRDELFLPFLTVTRVRDLDEALAEANAVPYGLTAGVFSEDETEVERFLDEIEAGVVYVNRRAGATTGAWPGIQSFPGWKSSGLSAARAASARTTCSSSCASRAARSSPRERASPTLALADAPRLVTDLPGPMARAHIERDERRDEPVADARLPARAGARPPAAWSRTSTETCCSTSTRGSRSPRPATRTPRSSRRSAARPASCSTSPVRTSTCPATPRSASGWRRSSRTADRRARS